MLLIVFLLNGLLIIIFGFISIEGILFSIYNLNMDNIFIYNIVYNLK